MRRRESGADNHHRASARVKNFFEKRVKKGLTGRQRCAMIKNAADETAAPRNGGDRDLEN